MKITAAEPSEKDHNPASVRARMSELAAQNSTCKREKTTATMYFLHPPVSTCQTANSNLPASGAVRLCKHVKAASVCVCLPLVKLLLLRRVHTPEVKVGTARLLTL